MSVETPAKPKNNTMAMVSFISGLGTFLLVCLSAAVNFMSFISMLGSLVAVITGAIGLGQIKKSNGAEGGRGFAITGLVLGILFFLLSCLLIVFFFVLAGALGDIFQQIQYQIGG